MPSCLFAGGLLVNSTGLATCTVRSAAADLPVTVPIAQLLACLAADHGISIVSISGAQWLDRFDHECQQEQTVLLSGSCADRYLSRA